MRQLTTGTAILYTVRMSRPYRTLCTLAFALVSLVTLDGCRTRTVYTSMYSPERSYFVPPVEKKIETVLPPETGRSAVQTPVVPALTPAPTPEAAPVIPGLDQPAPALPMAQ